MWFCYDARSTGSSAGSVPFPNWKCERPDVGSSTFLVQGRVLLRGFLLFLKNKQVLLWVVGGEGFHDNWDLGSQKILPSLRTSTYEVERTLDSPRRLSRQGTSPLVVSVVVVGPFEEEEEGTGVACNVVKVEGEDPDTPGYLRGDRVRLGRRRSRIVGQCVSLGSLTMKPRDRT